jgi:hypothetical protein
MTFMVWLSDQLDELGRVPRFSKVIFDDINNGCGSAKFGPIEWKEHFEAEHREHSVQLIGLLTIAYANYVMDTRR